MSRIPDHTLAIDKATLDNDAFRQELITGKHCQLVVMAIGPGEEIGAEVHEGHDQILVFLEGKGEAILDGKSHPVGPNDLTFVAAGVRHNFVNTGDTPLKLYTIYGPPEHPAGTRHGTKAEADEAEHDH